MRLPAGPKCVILGGAALGALALANRLAAPRNAPPLPRHRFVQVDGVRLHYIEQGEGCPVVLLHGNGAMAEDFVASGIVPALAKHHRVIAFDRPGFGYSQRPRWRVWTFAAQADLLHLALRRLGINTPPVIVGHSAGSLAALEMALRDRQGTAALVLLSGFYFPRLRADMLATSALAAPLVRPLAAFAIANLLGWLVLPAYLRIVFAPNPVSDRFRRLFPVAATLRPRQVQATLAETALLGWSTAVLARRLDELRLPVTILAGARDKIVAPARHSRRLHRRLPGSHLCELDHVGHMVHHAAPKQVIAAIELAARLAPSPPLRGGEGNQP